MGKERKRWLTCIKHIALASLAAFGVYMASAMVLAAIFEQNQTVRFAVGYAFLMVTYALFFYRFHAHDRLDTYAEHTDSFNWKKELVAYIRSEDKVLFLIFGISALITDISGVVTQYAPANILATVTMFYMGPWLDLKIPVLCTVVSFVYASVLVCAEALIRSRKIHKEKAELLAQKKQ